MSWQDYVNFMKANNVTSAAYIFSNDTCALWATHNASDPGVLPEYEATCEDESGKQGKYKVNEAKILLGCLKNNGIASDKVVGIRFGGVKYQSVRYDNGDWFLKSKEPKGGACICLTGKCIVVGIYNEAQKTTAGKGQNPGDCNGVVMDLAGKLRQAGF